MTLNDLPHANSLVCCAFLAVREAKSRHSRDKEGPPHRARRWHLAKEALRRAPHKIICLLLLLLLRHALRLLRCALLLLLRPNILCRSLHALHIPVAAIPLHVTGSVEMHVPTWASCR